MPIATRKRIEACGGLLWFVFLLISLITGYVGGSRIADDSADSEGMQKGYRIAVLVSIQEPRVWHTFVDAVKHCSTR